MVGLDPSLGTGGDNAAIQVFEANTTTQVAEWKHNRTVITDQVKLLKEICNYIFESTGEVQNIYFSVENNTIGEAALMSIADMGEENIKGTFLSEPSRISTGRRFRKGFNTTPSSKISACAKMKHLIESKRMTVKSRALISELKTFVASGRSYAAKLGETDDLVMATILCVRGIDVIQTFDADVSKNWRDHDDIIQPMPFIAIL